MQAPSRRRSRCRRAAARSAGSGRSSRRTRPPGPARSPCPCLSAGRAGFGPQLSLSYDSGRVTARSALAGPCRCRRSRARPTRACRRYDGRGTSRRLHPVRGRGSRSRAERRGRLAARPLVAPPHAPDYHGRPLPTPYRGPVRAHRTVDAPQRSATRTGGRCRATTSRLCTAVTTTPASRDPSLTAAAAVFSWLICESYDDKGNAAVYEYRAEDSTGVDRDARPRAQSHRRRRGGESLSEAIRYGNRTPGSSSRTCAAHGLAVRARVRLRRARRSGDPTPDDAGAWLCRRDAFSAYRAGFEVRTYRLCQRILMFHHFPGEQGVGNDCLVRSLDLTYRPPLARSRRQRSLGSFVASITQSGYRRRAAATLKRSLPAARARVHPARASGEVRDVDAESSVNLPAGADGRRHPVDRPGRRGHAGRARRAAWAWYYKPQSRGRALRAAGARRDASVDRRLAPWRPAAARPRRRR